MSSAVSSGAQPKVHRHSLWGAAALAALLALGIRNRASPADGPGGHYEENRRAGHPDWKAVFQAVRSDLTKRRIIAIAAGVTFYSLLAIFPAIAALVALYGLVANPATIAQHLDSLASFVPGGAIDVISEEINRIAAQSGQTKGLTIVVGLAVSLWSANGGVKALFDALNVVYEVDEKRGFIRLNATSLAFVIGGLVFVLVAIGVVVALPIVLSHIGLGEQARLIVSIGRWPALFVAVALMLAFIYRYGPDRPDAHWRWITWGSAFASIAWLIASILFSWYAANFGSYNKTYGSLGAVIGFMTWIWISAIVILMGAELDAVMERPQKARTASQPSGALQGSS
jgi:membrane protein